MVSIALIVLFLIAAGAVAHPRTRGYLIEQRPTQLQLDVETRRLALDGWKQVFREVVIASEGCLSPEIEHLLSGDAAAREAERWGKVEYEIACQVADAAKTAKATCDAADEKARRILAANNTRIVREIDRALTEIKEARGLLVARTAAGESIRWQSVELDRAIIKLEDLAQGSVVIGEG